MSARGRGRLALGLFGLALALTAAGAVFAVLGALDKSTGGSVQQVPITLILLAYSGLGALLVRRRPENRVGWIMLVAVMLMTFSSAGARFSFGVFVSLCA